MAAQAPTMQAGGAPGAGARLWWTVTDSLTMARRNLLRYVRMPELLFFSTVQPVMFVLLFNYVFGGAIAQEAGNYTDFLLPGIFVQTVLFGAMATGMGLAEDIGAGMIDRYRSLPMARSAVVAGRIVADTVRNVFVVLLMVAVGYLIGFRFHGGPLDSAAVMALAVLFGIPFSWISAAIGVSIKNVETVQTAGFFWIFPVVFLSSTFVPVETMPGWLQPIAEVNPVSVSVDTLRALSLGTPVGDAWWKMLAWVGGLTLLAAPLAVSRYRRL